MWWWRYILDHPLQAEYGLVIGLVVVALVYAWCTRPAVGADDRQDADEEPHDHGEADGQAAVSALEREPAAGGTGGADQGGNVVAQLPQPSAEFDSEAATFVGDAAQWFQTSRPQLAIVIEGAAKLKVEGKGSGVISGLEFDFDGEQEHQVPASADVKFVGMVRIAFTGSGTVRIGKDGIARLKQGGSLDVKDSGEVTFTEGALFEAANLPSVSAAFTISDGITLTATGCERVFGREGMRLLAARCGTVYATDGDIFAYKCGKVHATKDAVVYAVRCDDVSATERSRVCHLQCGTVWKSGNAVLEEHNTGR
jgi:hypothetical protein